MSRITFLYNRLMSSNGLTVQRYESGESYEVGEDIGERAAYEALRNGWGIPKGWTMDEEPVDPKKAVAVTCRALAGLGDREVWSDTNLYNLGIKVVSGK